MSREFRHVSSGYFHTVLEDAGDQPGSHAISSALAEIYRALAPLERDCASVEASDSGPSRATLGLQREWWAIEAAVSRLRGLYMVDCQLIEDLLRDRERMPAIPDLPLRRPPPAHDD